MEEGQRTEIAIRYATEWYTYHAGQRMTAVRFYLAIIGVLMLAYSQTTRPGWAIAIAVFGGLVSVVFWVLDVRNTELVNCGRAALDQLEPSLGVTIRADDLARRHFGDALRFLKPGDGGRLRRALTFQLWLRVLYVVTFAGSSLLAVSALWSPADRSPGPAIVGAQSPWSQVRTLRTRIEEYLLAVKQEADEVVPAAQGSMLEVETLAVLRSCRLELGADSICDRYEAWTDRVLDLLRPLRTMKGDQAKSALQGFTTAYSRGLRGELATIELELGSRASGSKLLLGPAFPGAK